MFYVTTLEHEIVLEPVYFGPKLRATIVRLLKEEVEGLVRGSVYYYLVFGDRHCSDIAFINRS